MLQKRRTSNAFNQGFTLLEMLIAIAIFAMLGLAASAVLQTVLKNDEVTKEFAKQLKGLQQGFGVIGRDLGQIVGRTARLDNGERSKTIFLAGEGILGSQTEGLSFYRLGWLNPEGMLPRGTIQAVAYVQVEDKLERWFYPYPDPEIGSEPQKIVLMSNVESVAYSFFTDNSWQKNVTGTEMPKAIAVEIELKGAGKIQRKFLLPELSQANANKDNNGGNNENIGNSGNNANDSNNGQPQSPNNDPTGDN